MPLAFRHSRFAADTSVIDCMSLRKCRCSTVYMAQGREQPSFLQEQSVSGLSVKILVCKPDGSESKRMVFEADQDYVVYSSADTTVLSPFLKSGVQAGAGNRAPVKCLLGRVEKVSRGTARCVVPTRLMFSNEKATLTKP